MIGLMVASMAIADEIDPGFVETCTTDRCAGSSKTCRGYTDRDSEIIVHREDCVTLETEGWTSVCRTGQSPWHWTEVMCKPDEGGVLEAPPAQGSMWCATAAPVGGGALLALLALRRRRAIR